MFEKTTRLPKEYCLDSGQILGDLGFESQSFDVEQNYPGSTASIREVAIALSEFDPTIEVGVAVDSDSSIIVARYLVHDFNSAQEKIDDLLRSRRLQTRGEGWSLAFTASPINRSGYNN